MKWLDKLLRLGEDTDAIDEPTIQIEGRKTKRWDGKGRLPLTQKQWDNPLFTTSAQAQDFSSMESFVDLLEPRMVIDDPEGNGDFVLLKDLSSVGVGFELDPIVADGRSEKFMHDALDKVIGILRDAIPADALSPWMMQITMQDEASMDEFKKTIEAYPVEKAKNTDFSKEWIRILKEHMDDVADPTGLFEDTMVSGGIWFARWRKVRIYIWRALPNVKKDTGADISRVIANFEKRAESSSIKLRRLPGDEVYQWLSRFLVPASEDYLSKSMDEQLNERPYPKDESLRMMGLFEDGCAGDLGKMALHGTRPQSDDQGNWYLTGKPTRFISVSDPSKAPTIGLVSAELENGDKRYALWDKMPLGSVWSQVIIFESEDTIMAEIDKLESRTMGDSEKIKAKREYIKAIRARMARGETILKSFMGVFVQGKNLKDLDNNALTATSWINAAGLNTIDPHMDLLAQDSFIRALPFNFNRKHDSKPAIRRARKWFIRQLAMLVPFYGRSRGTGNPGFLFFNRGGEPFTFDPLKDRMKNAFALILGPTGSGKSALLNFTIAQYIAFHNARFFVIEKGKSFYLLGKFLKKFGVKVHQITVTPNNPISLNPFNDAYKLPEVEVELFGEEAFETKPTPGLVNAIAHPGEEDASDMDEEDAEDEQRDELGEMLVAAITMITGGDEAELQLLRRYEQYHISLAIIDAGKRTRERGYTLPEDIEQSFRKMAQDTTKYTEKHRERLNEFADAMAQFCTGFRGKFFNVQGEQWPDADITIFDVGAMVSDQYSDMLGVSVVSMLNKIISIAERDQYTGRPIITLADEGHLTTTNPLIAPIVTNMTKMARKLNLWFWLATQNLKDFKDTSAKMLSNFEWWITMSTTQDEVDQISRFKNLTDDQKALLLAARKEPGKYTEGVVMSDNLLSLFRNVPPTISMALAQTEGHEKVARREIMDAQGIAELDSAYVIAGKMRESRKAS